MCRTGWNAQESAWCWACSVVDIPGICFLSPPPHHHHPVFKVRDGEGAAPTAQAPALSLDVPLQRKREYLARRGCEDLNELQEGGVGSMGRELVADVGGGTSGELGLPWGTTDPPPPFLRWSMRSLPLPPCSQSQERDFSKLASVYPVTDSLALPCLALPCQLPLTSGLLSHLLIPTQI